MTPTRVKKPAVVAAAAAVAVDTATAGTDAEKFAA
jgi:hypothetical protein